MSSNDTLQAVQDIGLSEKEARVYLAALSLGPSTVQAIAKAADVKRTTVYPVFESLEHQGLMSAQMKGFKKLFVAEHPRKLRAIHEEKQQRFTNTLDQLLALYNLQSGGAALKHYEQFSAIKSVYMDLLTEVQPKDDYLIISSGVDFYHLDTKFFDNFFKKRSELDVFVRGLLVKSDWAEQYAKDRSKYNEEIRFFTNKIAFSVNMVIIPTKILIHQLQDPMWAIVIENKHVIQTFRALFEICWDTSEGI